MTKSHTGKHHIGKRAVCLMLCTALFGGVWAGAADYTCSTCGSVHHITDVADIAETALPSVVSITNISVQEAQQYFNRFDRYGHNSTELKETTSVGSGIIFEKRGECIGEIIEAARGEGGFGYDPHFLYQTGETFSEMSAEDKNRVSHRARAMQAMLPLIQEIL